MPSYSARLLCSNMGCCAVFDAEGEQAMLSLGSCPYCGCQLVEAPSPGGDGAAGGDGPSGPLELRVLQGPLARRALRD